MRAPVQRNDAGLVNHLVSDDDIAGNLEDLGPHVVAGGSIDESSAARDAAIVRPEVLEVVERVRDDFVGEVVIVGASGHFATRRSPSGVFGGDPSIRRLDDQRGLPRRRAALTAQCDGGPVPGRWPAGAGPVRFRHRARACRRRCSCRAANSSSLSSVLPAEFCRSLVGRSLHVDGRPETLQSGSPHGVRGTVQDRAPLSFEAEAAVCAAAVTRQRKRHCDEHRD